MCRVCVRFVRECLGEGPKERKEKDHVHWGGRSMGEKKVTKAPL